jgi:two-component system, OmpR family, sensor histidine kinase KdpD
MATDPRFPELVSLAAHDLRTPLATVSGFASTLLRLGTLDPQSTRYVELIEASGAQLAEIVDDLGVVARIQGGRFEPALEEADSLELARESAGRVGDKAAAGGEGAAVRVDSELVVRALAGLANAAQRHGGAEQVRLEVDGATVRITPLLDGAAAVVTTEQLKDLGAAAGKAVVEALGGSVSVEGDALAVRLPQ